MALHVFHFPVEAVGEPVEQSRFVFRQPSAGNTARLEAEFVRERLDAHDARIRVSC